MTETIKNIARIIEADAHIVKDRSVDQLFFDSRTIYSADISLFIALKGQRRDGHQFINDLYEKGIRNFIISNTIDYTKYPEANFLKVKDTLLAVQQLAAWHRKQFSIPVIGITGSNGKTIVKEWLYQLLHQDYNIVRSPKSYNSQIGVPLSVWQMNAQHTLGIFEAGISQRGEMEKLERIIQPTIGVLTTIGEAHSEGFSSLAEKESEKRKLFIHAALPEKLEIIEIKKSKTGTTIIAKSPNNTSDQIAVVIPFTDDASIQNAINCWQVMLHLGYKIEIIQQRMKLLTPVNMRLELIKGINHCTIINDSYSADLNSLEIALNFLDQQSAGIMKTVLLSNFLQTSTPDDELYTTILNSLRKHNVTRLIGIGEKISIALQKHVTENKVKLKIELYPSTENFIQHFRSYHFKEETILIKGARIFAFEQIVKLLEQKVHQTVLEINLNAIVNNLKEYQKLLNPATKVMAMVKAFAYGSGGAEIAGILQYQKVDYLGVAYADEGVELRRAGITLPIMVMNPEQNTFESIIDNKLEPEIYSFELLNAFQNYLEQEGLQNYPVHIEIETGMNRLGFNVDDISKLTEILSASNLCKVQTVFTHLAASEEKEQDTFTGQQFDIFKKAVSSLQKLSYKFYSHIANSAAIVRCPEMQMDMVRLGIGLYGVDSAYSNRLHLQTVATLKSTIAQIKHLKKGESIGYNRKTILEKDAVIATIRIGYADGYPRRLGNGIGKIWVKGKLAPLVGSVCMDMIMTDISGIDNVNSGDDVIIFGKQLPVEQVAEWANTIPYEIMTGISQRVKRVYFEE